MSDVERDDIREMRRQGDLGRFLRDQIRAGNARREAPPTQAPPKPPGYKPGARPVGMGPPGPPPAQWSAEWDAALADYRAHIVATEHRAPSTVTGSSRSRARSANASRVPT